MDPNTYDSWYTTARGQWMGTAEARALIALGALHDGQTLLDAGCGSGWFSRQFAAAGCTVTGLDRDPAMLAYARRHSAQDVKYVGGDLAALPFRDRSLDIVAAVTSLCFVSNQCDALREMARVARHQVLLGLLQRHSLLYWSRRGKGAYAGAHWHTRREILALANCAGFDRASIRVKPLLFWPGEPACGRLLDALPPLRRFGAFLAVRLDR